MSELTSWREAVKMPVITDWSAWDYLGLEQILTGAIQACVSVNMEMNKGVICTTLSGGLDSSVCLAKVRQLVGPEVCIHTFTIGGSTQHPDVQAARLVSSLFQTNHHELIPLPWQINEASHEMHLLWGDKSYTSGDIAVLMTYCAVALLGFRCVIAHDGIDELLGGYWDHRKHDNECKKAEAFWDYWRRLENEHLLPLEKKAKNFYIDVVFPYLQKGVVEYIARIKLCDRTTLRESKIPLRTLARKYLPDEIVWRSKKGFCSALDKT